MRNKKSPKYIGNHVINHKVEQFVRALVLPVATNRHREDVVGQVTQVYANTEQLLAVHHEFDIVQVGYADSKGWRFHPTTNSILIMHGYNPDAVLLRLNSMVIEDHEVLVESAGRLITTFGSLVALAYECTYKETYKLVAADHIQHVINYGIPKHFATAVHQSKAA